MNTTIKSLNEQINEVKNSQMSRRDKVQALIKLGLRQNEVSVLLPVMHTERQQRFTFTFGVEIECVMPRQRFEAVANATGVNYRFEYYNHRDNSEYFKFTTDSSINTTAGREGSPIECVSPVLDGTKAGFDKLKACCEALNVADAYVNRSTGLHVHIGARHLTGEQYVNVFKNYQKLYSVVCSFMAESRRRCHWCDSLDGFDFSRCHTASDVYNEMNGDRYHCVNPVAFGAHGTIEFRQHQGTTNFKKIKMWVTFVSKLVAWSMNNVLDREVTAIDEIPFLTAAEKRWFNARKEALNAGREREAA